MKTPLAVLGVSALILAFLWFLGPRTPPESPTKRLSLPWQIEILPDGSSRVFDLTIGHSTLADAIERFGPYEDGAVFLNRDGGKALEFYFGNVKFGPLSAKIIVRLATNESELDATLALATAREGSPSGDWKLKLPQRVLQTQHQRHIGALTYIPGYGGLDPGFFRARFGEPDAWRIVDTHTTQWFYADQGLSIVLNEKGKEVLEYSRPDDFVLPDDVATEAR